MLRIRSHDLLDRDYPLVNYNPFGDFVMEGAVRKVGQLVLVGSEMLSSMKAR